MNMIEELLDKLLDGKATQKDYNILNSPLGLKRGK